MNASKKPRIIAVVSLVIVLIASILATGISSDWGKVQVSEVRLVTEQNVSLYAKLWMPKDASPENKLPAIVMAHGYSAHYNNMVGISLEFARRGYIVIAFDAYAMGYSEANDPVAYPEWDDGAYAVLQYLGSLPQVDKNRIGMIGHSRGNMWNQNAAATAWKAHDTDPSVTVPRSLVIASFSFNPIEKLPNGSYGYALNAYPVNAATIFGSKDEFGITVWNTDLDNYNYTHSPQFVAGAGVRDLDMDIYFMYGNKAPLQRDAAIAIAGIGKLRAAFTYPNIHILAAFNNKPIGDMIEFMDITLRGGAVTLDRNDQVWATRQCLLFFGFFGVFVFVISLALSLADTRFFATIKRPQPASMNEIHNWKEGGLFALLFLCLQLPMLLLYFKVSGWPGIYKTWQLLPQGPYFSAPGLNPTVVMNLITAAILILVVVLVYFFIGKKRGATLDNLGFNIPGKQIGKAILLGLTTFGIAYLVLCLFYDLTGTFVSFMQFSITPMNHLHWVNFLKYLPFWLLAHLVNAVVFNSVTRVNNAKEWVNYLLIILGSSLAIIILLAVQYTGLYATGHLTIENSGWKDLSTNFSTLELLSAVIITPVCAITNRVMYKKTGSVWAGGILSALLALLFGIGHVIIASV
ncbi:MAG: hypothetical protein IJK77_02620 [Lachnospiraceae bacterium]|nr:hypothetical protein [Lachnospiraceae bacterium]